MSKFECMYSSEISFHNSLEMAFRFLISSAAKQMMWWLCFHGQGMSDFQIWQQFVSCCHYFSADQGNNTDRPFGIQPRSDLWVRSSISINVICIVYLIRVTFFYQLHETSCQEKETLKMITLHDCEI